MIETLLADNTLTDAIAGEIKLVMVLGGGLLFATVVVITGMLKSVLGTRAREATKREMAAYVAEGSVKPEDAIRMLTAGNGTDACEIIAKRAADGWISAKKADQLIKSLEKQDAARA
ncbi:MAG: hypothetical protein Phyf2KO_16710 [Phycisphaerales bacterium]